MSDEGSEDDIKDFTKSSLPGIHPTEIGRLEQRRLKPGNGNKTEKQTIRCVGIRNTDNKI
jgi:hypothetical protein